MLHAHPQLLQTARGCFGGDEFLDFSLGDLAQVVASDDLWHALYQRVQLCIDCIVKVRKERTSQQDKKSSHESTAITLSGTNLGAGATQLPQLCIDEVYLEIWMEKLLSLLHSDRVLVFEQLEYGEEKGHVESVHFAQSWVKQGSQCCQDVLESLNFRLLGH